MTTLPPCRAVLAYAAEPANMARRQMTKGALAMVAAKAFPDPEERGRGKKAIAAIGFPMVTKNNLSHARAVLAYAPELADQVIAGTKSPVDAACLMHLTRATLIPTR
jgi:hypothetical protein